LGLSPSFVTFASAGLGGEALEALVKKLMGVIRSSVSSSSTPRRAPSQILDDPRTEAQKARFRAALEERYRLAKRFLAARALPPSAKGPALQLGLLHELRVLCFSAEELRKKLLDERGIGTVSMQDRYLRVAFSGVDADGDRRALLGDRRRRPRARDGLRKSRRQGMRASPSALILVLVYV